MIPCRKLRKVFGISCVANSGATLDPRFAARLGGAGFALPELMIVVVMLGILAGVALSSQVTVLDRVRAVVARFYVAGEARACSYALVSGIPYEQTTPPGEMTLVPGGSTGSESESPWEAACDSGSTPITFTATWGGEGWSATVGAAGQVQVLPAGSAESGGGADEGQQSGPPETSPACVKSMGKGPVDKC